MRVKFTSPFDYVTLRTKSGTPRATVAYQPGEPITVKREHGEAAVKAGKAVEVDEVAVRGGKVDAPFASTEKGPPEKVVKAKPE